MNNWAQDLVDAFRDGDDRVKKTIVVGVEGAANWIQGDIGSPTIKMTAGVLTHTIGFFRFVASRCKVRVTGPVTLKRLQAADWVDPRIDMHGLQNLPTKVTVTPKRLALSWAETNKDVPYVEGKNSYAPVTVVLESTFSAKQILISHEQRAEVAMSAKASFLVINRQLASQDPVTKKLKAALKLFITMVVHHATQPANTSENEYIVLFPGLKPFKARAKYFKGQGKFGLRESTQISLKQLRQAGGKEWADFQTFVQGLKDLIAEHLGVPPKVQDWGSGITAVIVERDTPLSPKEPITKYLPSTKSMRFGAYKVQVRFFRGFDESGIPDWKNLAFRVYLET